MKLIMLTARIISKKWEGYKGGIFLGCLPWYDIGSKVGEFARLGDLIW